MTTPARRSRVDLYTPAEVAIRNAIMEVEKVGADIRLTNAVVTLNQAQDWLQDYILGECINRGPLVLEWQRDAE